MRIVIDMQGAQTVSRFRGIGRYTLSFSQAVARCRREHEIIIALNGLFPDTIEPIRGAFDGLLPQKNIRVWYAPGPVRQCEPGNDSRRIAAECIREAFLASLAPDLVHVCSFFEGYEDDAVTSIGSFNGEALVSVTLHDLISRLNPDHYLKPNPFFAEYYQRQLEYFKRAALYFARSEALRQEGLVHLGLPASRVINTSDDAEAAKISWDESARRAIAAWESLRPERRAAHQSTGRKPRLAFVSPLPPERSGIADDSAQLLPALAGYYDIDVVAAQDRVDDPWISKHCAIRDVSWLLSHAGDVDRVLYHVGDSPSYQHLYKLLRMIPGVVALHDFFLPNLFAQREKAGAAPHVWTEALYYSHGYGAVSERFHARDLDSVVSKYPCNLDVLQRALGLIVKSNHSLDLARQWYGSIQEADWAVIPQAPGAECARRYADAIERFHRRAETTAQGLIRFITAQKAIALNDTELQDLSQALAATLPLRRRAGRLFLDVSTTSHSDRKTGTERVVRALARALIDAAPSGYRVEPVYLSNEEEGWRYRYARRYTLDLLECPTDVLADEIVEPECGDVLIGLDNSGDLFMQAEREGLYVDYRNRGVTVYFMIHDLLPVTMPEVFPPGADDYHAEWLEVVSKFDGAICGSKAVADDLARWLKDSGLEWSGQRPFRIAWSHHGADLESTAASYGLPDDAQWMLGQLRSRPSFLMDGMIEPRQGHLQVLEAFTRLWQQDLEINLVVVGKEGWTDLPDEMRRTIPETIRKLRSHPELDQRLFWLEGVSDEYREKIYAASACLIAASYGEGFGLPLIEAARHQLPIIARDIPVFREVAGECAFYFKGSDSDTLVTGLRQWLSLRDKNKHPKSDDLPWFTWKESAATLFQCLSVEDYRLGESSGARHLGGDLRTAEAPCWRQTASILGDEAINQPTRHYAAGENGNPKSAVKFRVGQRAGQAEAGGQLAKILSRQAEERAEQAEAKAERAEVYARQAEASAQQADQRVALAEARVRQAEIKAQQAEERAAQAEATLQLVFSSHSWRVTKPLRRLVSIVNPKREEGNAKGSKSTGDQTRTTPNWSETSADSGRPLDLGVSGIQESALAQPGLLGINADQRSPLESSFHSYLDKLI